MSLSSEVYEEHKALCYQFAAKNAKQVEKLLTCHLHDSVDHRRH